MVLYFCEGSQAPVGNTSCGDASIGRTTGLSFGRVAEVQCNPEGSWGRHGSEDLWRKIRGRGEGVGTGRTEQGTYQALASRFLTPALRLSALAAFLELCKPQNVAAQGGKKRRGGTEDGGDEGKSCLSTPYGLVVFGINGGLLIPASSPAALNPHSLPLLSSGLSRLSPTHLSKASEVLDRVSFQVVSSLKLCYLDHIT